MAFIKEITYEVGATVKVREYEYCKPMLSITISLDEDDNEEKVFRELTEELRRELKKEIKKLKEEL